eukprot:2370701-Pyramimonas_sp.AAC.1
MPSDRPVHSLCTGLPQACGQPVHRPVVVLGESQPLATGLCTACAQACHRPVDTPVVGLCERRYPATGLCIVCAHAYSRPVGRLCTGLWWAWVRADTPGQA